MLKIAVFPGSFDPITIGHVDIIERSKDLFDKIVVAIGNNTQKTYQFRLETRQAWIKSMFKDQEQIEVASYEGLTVDFCKVVNANYIIRGVRSSADLEYEKTVAQLNKSMADNIETILIVSRPELSHISSTIVREIIKNGGDISQFVPKEVKV